MYVCMYVCMYAYVCMCFFCEVTQCYVVVGGELLVWSGMEETDLRRGRVRRRCAEACVLDSHHTIYI
jgi:hypothetical protein